MLLNLGILFLAILGLYAIAMSRVAPQLLPARQRWHLAWFMLGLLIALFIFVPSPDLFGPDHRFTVNMGQLLLAVDIAPPFLQLGIPSLMLQPLLRWEKLGRRLTAPYWVSLMGLTFILCWFVPDLFSAASGNLSIWLIKQLLFLIAGLLLWWPITGPLVAWRPSYPVQLVYLFIVRLPMTLLGVMLSFANQILYSARSFALEICAPSSISDQQVGGLVMWMGGGWILFVAFSIVFFHWFNNRNMVGFKEL